MITIFFVIIYYFNIFTTPYITPYNLSVDVLCEFGSFKVKGMYFREQKL